MSQFRFTRWLAGLPLSTLLAAGCGSSPTGTTTTDPGPDVTPTGTPISADIGPAGGTIAASDGLISVTFPAGALAATTTVTIQPIVNTAPSSIGTAYQIKPNRLAVSKPVTITMPISPATLGDLAPEGLGIGVLDSAGKWRADFSSTVDVPAAGARATGRYGASSAAPTIGVSLPVTSTMPFAVVVVTYWRVQPTSATVAAGGTVPITILACTRTDVPGTGAPDDDLLASPSSCAPSVRQGTWSVNGIVPGNQTVGTVLALSPTSKAQYTAPQVPPPLGFVNVQASMLWVQKGVTKVFTIPIRISGVPWTGSVTLTTTGDTTWTEANGATTTWNYSGGATIDVKADSLQPAGDIRLVPKTITANALYKRHTHHEVTDGSCSTIEDEDETVQGYFADLNPAPHGWGGVILQLSQSSYTFIFAGLQFQPSDTTVTTTTQHCPGEDDVVITSTYGSSSLAFLTGPIPPPTVNSSPGSKTLADGVDFADPVRLGMKDRLEWKITTP
jgi:hypothetical protein